MERNALGKQTRAMLIDTFLRAPICVSLNSCAGCGKVHLQDLTYIPIDTIEINICNVVYLDLKLVR